MEINLVQGDDSKVYKFQRKSVVNNEVIKTSPQKIWITFKYAPENKNFLFQKTLGNGITYNENDFYYRFQIKKEDTEKLYVGRYGFDIAILNEAGEKKTLLNNGILNILDHYTKKENEV